MKKSRLPWWMEEEAAIKRNEGKKLCCDCAWEKEEVRYWRDGGKYYRRWCSHPAFAHDMADGVAHKTLGGCSLFIPIATASPVVEGSK